MKINEVLIKEGPLDFAKKAGAGIKGFAQGGVAGARAGYQSAEAGIEQKALIDKVASKALQSWATISQNIKTSGQPISVQDAVDWYKGFTNITPTTRPVGVSPANINQWLTKEIAGYMAKKAKAQQAQPQQAQQPQQVKTPTTGKKVTKGAGDDYYMGGQKLDPKNPKEKEIIDRVKQQTQAS